MLLRFHTQTGGSTLTAQQPENNIVRTTVQALAAVLGGTQSLHTNAFDEALALPTEKSAEIALRTQQILAFESGVTNSVDPLGGSYLVEYLTDQIEQKVLELMDRIDDLGGSVAAISEGFFKNEIARSAYDFQKKVESNEAVVVGVNHYRSDKTDVPAVLKVDPGLEKKQAESLGTLRKERDGGAASASLKKLDETARKGDNIMYPILEAVENYATVGEISDRLRQLWGEYHEKN